jgi:drug/metabolite transporter (DMT)-like permease
MRQSVFLFAVLMGVSAATYTVCVKLASARINPALGAMVVTGSAFFVNLAVLLVMRARGVEVVVTRESLGWLVLAGVGAAGIDLFALLAFARGLEVTASFMVGGVHASLLLLVGFLVLGEPFTMARLLAILLIAAGIALLQRASV